MNHVVPVRISQRAGNRDGDPHGFVDRQLLFAIETGAKTLAFDKGHHIEQESVGVTGIEQWQEIRVLQIRRYLYLGQESFGAQYGAELGIQNLEGNVALVADVTREVDRCHAAGADLPLDDISAGECLREFRYDVAAGLVDNRAPVERLLM
jgi:hypothetical protein